MLRRHRQIFNSLGLSDPDVITSHVTARLTGYLNGYGSLDNLMKEIGNWNLNEHQEKAIIRTIQNKVSVGGSCSF